MKTLLDHPMPHHHPALPPRSLSAMMHGLWEGVLSRGKRDRSTPAYQRRLRFSTQLALCAGVRWWSNELRVYLVVLSRTYLDSKPLPPLYCEGARSHLGVASISSSAEQRSKRRRVLRPDDIRRAHEDLTVRVETRRAESPPEDAS